MRALVTGCAGFIGSHLTEELLSRGWTVLGIDAFAPTYETASRRDTVQGLLAAPRFSFIEGDLAEMDLGPTIEGADFVFHLAARPGVRASWMDFGSAVRANISALQRLLDALRRQPSTRLIFASSSSVYGQASTYPTSEDTQLKPISPYGVTKAAGEALVGAYASQYGLDAVMLRYFTVYGPRQRSDMAFHKWITAGLDDMPLPLFGDGTSVRDFTYVDDVVNATIAATQAKEGCHAYNVAGGSPATLLEVFEHIESILGQKLRFNHLSGAKGDPARTGGDTTLIKEQLGWEPRISLEQGLGNQIGWLKQHLTRT